MRTYEIKKVQGRRNWKKIPVMPMENLLWCDPVNITAQTQICWDDNALYIRQEAVEKKIRMKETGPMAVVCQDSCMEFFFRPTERLDYFNFEINPNRALHLGFGTSRDNSIRLQVKKAVKVFDIKVKFTDKGWVVTYQIPFDFIRRFFPEFEAKEGLQLRANAYKCGDKTAKQHFLAWNPIVCENPSFHMPEQFGCIVFGGE